MNLLNLKEMAGKFRFALDRIRYNRKRHLNLTLPVFLLILVIIFVAIFSFQQAEIKRKENILKSYYSGESHTDDTGGSGGIYTPAEEGIEEKIQVHICGEVKEPGVYELEMGTRINDLIKIAGGTTADAMLSAVNLARELCDGQKVYIPSEEEVSQQDIWSSDYQNIQDSVQISSSLLININTAGMERLQSLPGIGPVIAGNIIKYRENHGRFSVIEEMKRVEGIGPKKYEEIKDLITV